MAQTQEPKLSVQLKENQKVISLSLRTDDEGRKDIAKRSHDITAGLRTIRFAIDSIRDGYRFEDNLAAAKISAMEKAIANLEREVKVLSDVYQAYFEQTTSG